MIKIGYLFGIIFSVLVYWGLLKIDVNNYPVYILGLLATISVAIIFLYCSINFLIEVWSCLRNAPGTTFRK